MKKDLLAKAIGKIDDDLIEAADKMPLTHKKRAPLWVKVGSIAAALLLLILAAALILPQITRKPSDIITSEDLELLSFAVVDEDHATRLDTGHMTHDGFEMLADRSEEIMVVGGQRKTFRATVKNMKRAPFIDLVVYLSWKGTSVVFNEGHGEYQCASTTAYEDGLWVTNIEFELDVRFDDRYLAEVEIEQITFLQSENRVVNVSLEEKKDVRRMTLALVRSEDFTLTYEDVAYEIAFREGKPYATALEALSPDAEIREEIRYEDYAGIHTCPVISVGDGFLKDYKQLTSVTIPETVMHLGPAVFKDCTRLESISFGGTALEWNERFSDDLLETSCIPVVCKDGKTSVGRHQTAFGYSGFDPDARTCVTPTLFCARCGKALGGGETRHLVYSHEATESFTAGWPVLDRWFEFEGSTLTSPTAASFEEPVDLTDAFVISIEFETNDPDTLKKCGECEFRLSSSGQSDREAFVWPFEGDLFDRCVPVNDEGRYRISFCDPGTRGTDFDRSRVSFARMMLSLPEGSGQVAFKITKITWFSMVDFPHVHKVVTDAAVAPTCTTAGLTEGSHCATCHEVLCAQTVIPATGHVPVVVPKLEATCTTPGMTDVIYCDTCGEILSYEQVDYYLDHEFENGKCIHCGCSDHLEYSYHDDLGGYLVSGAGNCLQTDIVIPEIYMQKPVVGVGDKAFENCLSPTSVKLPAGALWIGDSAFSNCTNLESIDLGQKLEVIQYGAFSGCRKLNVIRFPKTLKEIHSDTFEGCLALSEFQIPASVNFLGQCFWGRSNPNLKRIVVDEESLSYSSVDGILFDKGQTTLLCYPAGKTDKNYLVPQSVTIIDIYAFEGNVNLQNVTLPESLTEIRTGAFMYSKLLESIKLPKSLKSIEYGAFWKCPSLKTVVIQDGVEIISNGAFCGCSALSSVTLPGSVKKLPQDIFNGCKSLGSIVIPDSVTQIEEFAFAGCSGLTSVTLSHNLRTIGYEAFGNCTSLEEIVLPETLQILRGNAFLNCENLCEVTFQKCPQNFEEGIFSGCDKLKHITCCGTAEMWNEAMGDMDPGLPEDCVIEFTN